VVIGMSRDRMSLCTRRELLSGAGIDSGDFPDGFAVQNSLQIVRKVMAADWFAQKPIRFGAGDTGFQPGGECALSPFSRWTNTGERTWRVV
jgi:hypothetical protein